MIPSLDWLSLEALSLLLSTVALVVASFAFYRTLGRTRSRASRGHHRRGMDTQTPGDLTKLQETVEGLQNIVARLNAAQRGETTSAGESGGREQAMGLGSGSALPSVATVSSPSEAENDAAPVPHEGRAPKHLLEPDWQTDPDPAATPARDPVPSETVPPLWTYSLEGVRELYQRWCDVGMEPEERQGLEVAPLKYVRAEPRQFDQPLHLFKDARQIAEFVRFTPEGEGDGHAFPHPQASFKPQHQLLFDLSESAFADGTRGALASVEPLRIARRHDGLWQQVSSRSES